MDKKIEIKRTRNAEHAWRVARTAEITGLNKASVYRIIRGVRENETVITVYMDLLDGDRTLVNEVKKLVPFN